MAVRTVILLLSLVVVLISNRCDCKPGSGGGGGMDGIAARGRDVANVLSMRTDSGLATPRSESTSRHSASSNTPTRDAVAPAPDGARSPDATLWGLAKKSVVAWMDDYAPSM